MIVDEENAGQYYPDFAFNHPLFSDSMRIYSDSKVCRLQKSISKDQINAFLNEWNDNRDHKQPYMFRMIQPIRIAMPETLILSSMAKLKMTRDYPYLTCKSSNMSTR